MKNKFDYFKTALESRLKQNHYRQLRCTAPLDEVHLINREKRMINFTTNDFLGISSHPFIKKNTVDTALKWGAGSTPSRLLTPHLTAFEKCEKRLAELIKTEEALLFCSDFQLPHALISALCNPKTVIYIDRSCRPQLMQSSLTSSARVVRFEHNDIGHLKRCLERDEEGGAQVKVIITESLFHVDGSLSPLWDLAELAHAHSALFVVDDSLTSGVMGQNGMGRGAHQLGIDILLGTFNKVCGVVSSFLGTSSLMKNYLLEISEEFSGRTVLPPAVLGSVEAMMQLIPDMETEREALTRKCTKLRNDLKKIEFVVGESASHIVHLHIGDDHKAGELFETLRQEGIYTTLIKAPLVPVNAARIRLAISHDHTDDQLSRLLLTLQNLQHTARPIQSMTVSH